jgi:tetratricopeptide (TPR) repeat protein
MKTSILSCILILSLLTSLSFAVESLSSREYQDANRLYAAGKFSEALVRYRQALSTRPADRAAGDVQCRIGDIHFKMGDYASALASYRDALGDPKLRDRPQTQYWVGFCCFLVGRDAEAVTELLKVPVLYPEARAWGSTSYYWAGRASERMGKKEQAALYYRKAGGSGKSTQGKFAMKKAEAVKSR